MRNPAYKLVALGVVFGFAVLGSSCSKSRHSAGGAVAPAAATDDSERRDRNRDADVGEEDFSAAFTVANFRQLAAAYERATGVPLAGDVLDEYNTQLNSLPTDPDPTAISASQVSAATKLAAAFCDGLSRDQELRAQRFPELDFSNMGDSRGFAEILLDTFFGPVTSLQGERSLDVETVAELTDYLVTVPGATVPTIFMGACTAVLSSAEYYLN